LRKAELVYASSGGIQGKGFLPQTGAIFSDMPSIDGDWKIDNDGRICTSMRIGKTNLPYRCQFWFKYADQYFLSDSDSDRRTRVFRRTVKQ
jgi:hypothetical protein